MLMLTLKPSSSRQVSISTCHVVTRHNQQSTDFFQVHNLRVRVRVQILMVQVRVGLQVRVPVSRVQVRALITSTRVLVLVTKTQVDRVPVAYYGA